MVLANDKMKAGRYLAWQTARRAEAWIAARLAEGRDVYICTYTRQTRITPKNAKAWAKQGLPMFKATRSGLYIARGKSWDCIDGCKIVAQ